MASTPNLAPNWKPGANGIGKSASSPRPHVMPNAPPNYSPYMTAGTMFGTGMGLSFPSRASVPMPVATGYGYVPMVNPAMSGMAGRHARVVAACPVLELHRPLAAAAAIRRDSVRHDRGKRAWCLAMAVEPLLVRNSSACSAPLRTAPSNVPPESWTRA